MTSLEGLLQSFATALGGAGLLAPILAFVAGVITSFMPCCLSTIPLVIGYVGGSGADSRRGFRMATLFALGMALTMTALGVAAAVLGRLLLLGGSWFYLAVGVLMVLMSLQLFGVFEFIPATHLTDKGRRRGYFGALLAGILGGLFASPCSTPVLVVLLGLVATAGNMGWGIVLLLAYSLGHSVLILAVGASVGVARQITTSPRYRHLAKGIQMGMGLLTLALGLSMFYLGF